MPLSCWFRSFCRGKEKLAEALPAEKWSLLSVLFAALGRGAESFGSQQNVPSVWKINTLCTPTLTSVLTACPLCSARTLSVIFTLYPRVPAPFLCQHCFHLGSSRLINVPGDQTRSADHPLKWHFCIPWIQNEYGTSDQCLSHGVLTVFTWIIDHRRSCCITPESVEWFSPPQLFWSTVTLLSRQRWRFA